MFKISLRAYKLNEVERALKLIEEYGLRDTLSVTTFFPLSHDSQKALWLEIQLLMENFSVLQLNLLKLKNI